MSLLEGLELPKTDRMKKFSVGSVNIMPQVRQSQIPVTRKISTTEEQDIAVDTEENTNCTSPQFLKASDSVQDLRVNFMEKLTSSNWNDRGNDEIDADNGSTNNGEGGIDGDYYHDDD